MGIKLTLTFENETMEILQQKARDEGFMRPSAFARYLLLRVLKEDLKPESNDDHQTIRVAVDNYRELKDFVGNKKFGTIEVFANFAMAQYMAKYPLKPAPKSEAGESNKGYGGGPLAVQPGASMGR